MKSKTITIAYKKDVVSLDTPSSAGSLGHDMRSAHHSTEPINNAPGLTVQ
ncbi:MAG TPA: hypothetical protein VFA81_04505 [Burkholderiales bacterium]|nr:hypothetical protein [Burkholderiales bacterium]